MLYSMCYAYIITYSSVIFLVDSFVDYALYCHIFEDILERYIEGDHIFVIFYKLGCSLMQNVVMHHQLFIESY
jgi:hypothetical protein